MFIARERILYIFDKREIGRQFFRQLGSFFFGIRRIVAPLKFAVNSPFSRQVSAYFSRGILSRCQHFLIRILEKPSRPDANPKLAFFRELSSSSRVSLVSRESASSLVSLEFLTISELQIFGPRKPSIIPS